ncbi:threonine transporter RhtB [Corallococcus sp. AB011P]|uniref:ABC-three component system middle component 2 n=1 Tax=Corallococcus sp. AB011P TaxID=2316735 RepID=UPI000EA0E31A|nr:ABC-three component system middle component 2 [Corallococcus sp. AB011P]RKG62462.1 threonine transporter RhtB [Corallococcus sp. AB011P]
MSQIPLLFNSPFELGLRMVFLLLAAYPRKLDLQRLVYLDYAAIYSEDIGGAPSLHTPVPLRGAEYLSRRELIELGLYLMSTRGFVDVSATEDGIYYSAGENASSLVGLLGGSYSTRLQERCRWVAEKFVDFDGDALSSAFDQRGLYWGAQLVPFGDEQRGTGLD